MAELKDLGQLLRGTQGLRGEHGLAASVEAVDSLARECQGRGHLCEAKKLRLFLRSELSSGASRNPYAKKNNEKTRNEKTTLTSTGKAQSRSECSILEEPPLFNMASVRVAFGSSNFCRACALEG